MGTQSDIGTFDDEDSRDIELTAKDLEYFRAWNFNSRDAFNGEIITMIKSKQEKEEQRRGRGFGFSRQRKNTNAMMAPMAPTAPGDRNPDVPPSLCVVS